MHDAPSVSYPVGRSLFPLVFLAIAWGAGVLACGAWALQVEAPPLQYPVVAVALLITGACATVAWWRTPAGTLRYAQGSWTHDGAEAGWPSVALDLQRWMLLHWRGEGGERQTRWLWADQSAAAERWADLRRAVYSRAKPETLPGA